MDRSWQRQWDASRRQDNIRKILEVLKQSQLATGNESIQSLTEMASKFEETVFQSAESSEKYISKIATKLAKVSAKMSGPPQQQMVPPPALHIPPGHMPVSQLGGVPQQGGGNMLRSSSPSLYGTASPGLPTGYPTSSRGFNGQPNQGGPATALPMGPAGGVPITALGMGGAPPGSFGLNPEQSRSSAGVDNYNTYQHSGNRQQRQQLAPPQQVTPQQAWVDMRNREYLQRGGQNQGGGQKAGQQFAPPPQYGGVPQMLTPQQQQLYLQQQQLQQLQRQTQMQQGGGMPANQARGGGSAAPVPGADVEQLWQSLQQLKAKYLMPLTEVHSQVNAQLGAIAGQGKADMEKSLKLLKNYADRILTTLRAADRNQAVALQKNFSKGLGHFEQQLVQLLSTWHKKAKLGVDPAKKAQQEQQDHRLHAQATALQERQRMEQEILRKRQQQQQEQLLKQQAAQQAQARAQQVAIKQAAQNAAQQQQPPSAQSLPQQPPPQGSAQAAVAKANQQKILDQVLKAFAARGGITVPELVNRIQSQPELKKRVAYEVNKLQERLAQKANATSLPPPTPPVAPLPATVPPPFATYSPSPSPMPAQTPPINTPTQETFRAPSPVEPYKPFSPFPDNFKAPTPPIQSAPQTASGKQLSASGLTSPGGSAVGPTSPRGWSDGKPPISGAGAKAAVQSPSKGAVSGSTADVDVEDLPIALRSQLSSGSPPLPKDNPLKALAKKVWLLSQSSQSQSTLEHAASEIDKLVQLTNQYALVPPGTDSKSAKPENLVTNTRARLAGKGGGGVKRARGRQSVFSLGIDGSDFDAGSSISDANSCVDFQHSEDEAGSVKGGKRVKLAVRSAIEAEIDDVNRFLIDTRVEISHEGTKDAEMEGRKGTAVVCTLVQGGVSLSPLRLLVPPTYPSASPAVWHDYSAPSFSLPFAITARENFSASIRRLGPPLSIGAMARCWDQSVREAIADVALSQGGGCFSNTVGVWMHCA